MHISDLHDYNPEPTKVVEEFVALGRMKQIRSAIEQVVEDEFDKLQEYGDEHLSQVAADRAERFLARVLAGDCDAAIELFGCKNGAGRYVGMGCNEGKPWAKLIHGRLFETGGVELRRKIVEAHADLLRNERIADLESIVEGLSQQVRQKEAELEECRRGLAGRL